MPASTFKNLLQLAARLRSPDGCPWDRKQTIKSLLDHLAEEAEEVKTAIRKADHPNLQEELGDLIFLIIMIAQIAKEKKLFSIKEVLQGIEKKIISRHTWVFGKDKVRSPEEAIKLWKKNKAQEKKQKTLKK